MSNEEINAIMRRAEESVRRCLRRGAVNRITYVEETMIVRVGYFDADDVADLIEDVVSDRITYQVINSKGMKSTLRVGGKHEEIKEDVIKEN